MRCGALEQPGPPSRRRHRDLRGAGDPADLTTRAGNAAGGHVAALTIDLHLREARSLKDKRAVLRPILEGSRRRFSVAAAEVDHQQRWQRATLTVAVVSASVAHAEEVLDGVERFVWSFPAVDVLASRRDWLETEGGTPW